MKRTLLAISGSVLMLTSCVSSKVYKDLESRHADLKRDNRELKSELDRLKGVDEEL